MSNYYHLPIFMCGKHIIRTTSATQNVWFLGKDICYCLGIKEVNIDDALFSVPMESRKTIDRPITNSTEREILVNGEGVLHLCNQYGKKFKKVFIEWYNDVLMPALKAASTAKKVPSGKRQEKKRPYVPYNKKTSDSFSFFIDVDRYCKIYLKRELNDEQKEKLSETTQRLSEQKSVNVINAKGIMRYRKDVLDLAFKEAGI